MKAINFDMDGTFVDFYGVYGWLEDLKHSNARPYAVAKPLVSMSLLARHIHRLQKLGYAVNVISWLSKDGTEDFNAEVTAVKLAWLREHLPSVEFNEIHIVKYGTPKSTCGHGILFDDELQNRKEWFKADEENWAFDVGNLLEVLKGIR